MTLDLLISGGTVVDGTGAPGRRADVGDPRRAHRRDRRPSTTAATRTIDATGLVVAPGFVDLHTHYDAQLLWDPTASPSPLHGVTTVFGGNCGFTLAPARRRARRLPRRGSWPASRASRCPRCEHGVPWDWTTFGDYLERARTRRHRGQRRLPRRPLGAAPRRDGRRAVGEPATRRADRRDGAAAARRARRGRDGLLDVAGARRTTTATAIRCRRGRATDDELLRAGAASLAEHPGTQLELIIPGCLNGFTDDEVDLMTAMSRRGRPPAQLERARRARRRRARAPARAAYDHAAARGGRVVALTLPQGMRIRLSFLTGFVLDGLPGLARDDRRCRSTERMRALCRPAAARAPRRAAPTRPKPACSRGLARWERLEVDRDVHARRRAAYEGRTIGDIAARAGQGRRSTRCSTSWSPTVCAPACGPTSAARARRGVEDARPTCGATRAPSSAAPTPARTST